MSMIKKEYSKNTIKNYKYWFIEWVLDEKAQMAYFCGANLNMLYQYDLEKNVIEQLGSFPDMPESNQLFRGGVIHNNKIYFPPRMAAMMGIYDIEKKLFQTKDIYEEIDNKERFAPNNTGYISVKYQDERAFFIYMMTPFCVVMDLDSERISYITCGETGEKLFLGIDYCILKDFFIAPIHGHNKILLLNMKDAAMEIRELHMDFDDFCSSLHLAGDGKIYLLNSKNPSVLKWDPKTNELAEIAALPMDDIICEQGYLLRSAKDAIYVFPGLDLYGGNERAFRVDPASGLVSEISLFQKYKEYIKWNIISQKEKYIYAMVPSGQDIFFSDELIFVEYDWYQNSVSEKKLPIPQGASELDIAQAIRNYQEQVRFRYVADNALIYTEDEYLSLSGWINGIKSSDMKAGDKKEKCDNHIGKDIYNTLINL